MKRFTFFLCISSIFLSFSFASIPPHVHVKPSLTTSNQIKKDFKTTEQMVKIVKETIAQESMSFFVSDHEKGISNFKESMFLEEAYKEASKSFQQNNPTEVETLLNPKATDEERQQALNALNKEVANQLGITEDQVKLVLDKNPDNKYKGFTSAENNNMYIVKNNQDNAKDEASSAFNEFSDHYDIYNHLGVDNTDKTYKDNRDKYSELFGNIGADWLDFTYTSSGKNSLSTVVNENRYTNSYLVQTNTDEYNKLDKNQGAFRKLATEEHLFIDKVAPDYAKQRGITVEQAKEELTMAAEYYNDKEKQSEYNDALLSDAERIQKIAAIMKEYEAGNINSFEAQKMIYALEGTITPVQPEDSSLWLPPLVPQATTVDTLQLGYGYLVEQSGDLTYIDKYTTVDKEELYFHSNPWAHEDPKWDPNHQFDAYDFLVPLAGDALLGGAVGKVLGKIFPSVGAGKSVDDVVETGIKSGGARPTARQSEIDVGKQLPDDYSAQVSYKDGKVVNYGTKESVRPDFCNGNTCSIEVKNYDIETNQNGLINKVAEQAKQREQHLPQGMTQEVRIDTRGQSVSESTQKIIQQKIFEKSGGIIKPEDIKFF